MSETPTTDNTTRQFIRVVVVDDSALMRRAITDLIQQDPEIRVVGTARDGREAIALVEKLRPDVVTMDVRMPVMDGLETTEHLMAHCPTPILVLTASLARHDIDITFKMLGAGALEIIEKPSGSNPQALERTAHELIRRIKVLSRVKVVRHLRGRRKTLTPESPAQTAVGGQQPSLTGAVSPTKTQPLSLDLFPLIMIGASTGGPRVVYQILAALPRNLPAGVVVVQHIAPGFSPGMAEWLAHESKLPVSLVTEGMAVQPGRVFVAPDRRDLLITNERTFHLSENPLLIQRPAIDISMQAAADVFGHQTIGVLLTGMGRDGAYGMLAIRRVRGYTIAQDEATSAIFGMPRAAIQLGAADEVMQPAQIAPRLTELVADLVRTSTEEGRRNVL